MTEKPEGPNESLLIKIPVTSSEPKILSTSKYASEVPKKGWRRYGGLILAALASLFYSLTILTAKLLGGYHPFTISVWRFLGILIPGVPVAAYFQFKRDSPGIFTAVWPLNERENRINFASVQFRGFVGVGMVLLRFWALRYLTVADLAVTGYSGPVFVMLLAYIFLNERCGVIPILVSLLTVVGVFVILRPPIFTGQDAFDLNDLIGVGLGLASVMCNAVIVIMVRRSRKVHFSYTLVVGGIWGVAECVIIALAFGVLEFPRGTRDTILAFGLLPISGFLFQCTIIIALKFESAGPVSLVRSLDVIFAFIWQIVFLGVYPDVFSLVGAGIIVFGVAILTMRKWLSTLPPENESRERFRLLLR